jgi:hypothetical protein
MRVCRYPSAGPLQDRQAVGKEVRRRLGDVELVAGKHEGVYQMSIDDREEWRVQVGPQTRAMS